MALRAIRMHIGTVETQLSVSIEPGSACHRSIEISMQVLDCDSTGVCVFVCVCEVNACGGWGGLEHGYFKA